MRTLKQGMVGPDVARWQTFLNEQGHDVGPADGRFGPRTHSATVVWQRSEALTPDGIAGKQTLGRAGLLGMDTLRRITETESSPAIRAEATRILREHKRSPFGTEVPFDVDGRSYVARLEEHYHDPKGTRKPHGHHLGVSVFAVVKVATQEVDDDGDDEGDTIPVPPPVAEDPEPAQQFRLGATSLKRLRGVHPDLVRVVERAIQITPIDFMVVDGVRTIEQQRKNVANGASGTMNSRHLIGPDGYGHAVDLAPLVDGLPSWHWPHYRILRVPMLQAAKELGIKLRSGANWDQDGNWEEKGETDGPHWELRKEDYP